MSQAPNVELIRRYIPEVKHEVTLKSPGNQHQSKRRQRELYYLMDAPTARLALEKTEEYPVSPWKGDLNIGQITCANPEEDLDVTVMLAKNRVATTYLIEQAPNLFSEVKRQLKFISELLEEESRMSLGTEAKITARSLEIQDYLMTFEGYHKLFPF